jgi:hypothetical protein
MNRFWLFLIMLIPGVMAAQVGSMPYELERYATYDGITEFSSPEGMDESELISAYLNLYKQERSERHSEYFPSPSEARSAIGREIRTRISGSSATAWVDLLENGCSTARLNALVKLPSDFEPLLPYQALAAFSGGDVEAEEGYLRAMEDAGLFSPVLKAWGENALRSASGYGSIMTNGLQDLFAVRIGQLLAGIEPEIEIMNRLAERCDERSTQASAFGDMWIAPTVEPRILTPFSNRLQVVGIGFAMVLKENGNRLKATAKSLQMAESKTPADRGLVSSYVYLHKALEAAGERKLANALQNHIDKEGTP